MNLPPVSSNFAASLAGSVKAGGDKSSADATQGNTVEHQAADLQIDGALKSKASSDSEADGRQLLDTFERHSDADQEAEQEDSDAKGQAEHERSKSSDDDKPQRPRLDLQG